MNIFVAKLNYKTTSDSLRDLFEQYGTVDSAKVIMDRDTGRSKGFGFVEMPNDHEAQHAIEELDSTTFEESYGLVVKEARERENNNRHNNNNNNRGNRGGYGNRNNRGRNDYNGGGGGGGNYGGGYNKGY